MINSLVTCQIKIRATAHIEYPALRHYWKLSLTNKQYEYENALPLVPFIAIANFAICYFVLVNKDVESLNIDV